MNLNDIQLTDFIVAEWYKKDALLPLATGPLSKDTAPAASRSPTPPPAPATLPPATAAPPPPPTTAPSSAPEAPKAEIPQAAIPEISKAETAKAPVPETPKTAAPKAAAPTAAAPETPAQETPAQETPKAVPRQAATQEIPQAPDATYKYLGNNRRRIALLVHSPGSGFLPDNQLAFLTRILEACRMTIADVAIVNNAAVPVTITALRQQLQPRTVLLFGVDPTAIRLPINFPHFKQLNYDDCTYLSSPALDQLVPNTEDSKLLKSKLWVSLKTLFDV